MNIQYPSDDAVINQTLDQQIQQLITEQRLSEQRDLLQNTAQRLNIDLLDCAAALLYLSKPPLQCTPPKSVPTPAKEPAANKNYRFVRYRLDIGSQHQVAKEQIQAVLIDESGVDKKRIGRIDIHPDYTLVELPEGMPADIFQLLSEASIGERKLAIKRVKSNRRTAKRPIKQ